MIHATATRRGPSDVALAQPREWDPAWAETCHRMTINPWRRGILPHRLVELIDVMLNAQCTSLNPEETRRHIKRALEAGATVEEIMEVFELCVAQGVQSCNLGVPILAEELQRSMSR